MSYAAAHPLSAMLWAKLQMARHAVESVRRESKLKVAVVSIAAMLLWGSAFAAFLAGFDWLRNFDVSGGADVVSIGDTLMLRLLSVFALALFFMLVFSNLLIVYSTAYRSRELPFLLQAPMTCGQLFLGRFVECVIFSSWASAYLGSPLILAYGITTGAPWPFYLSAIAFYVPFVTVPAALSGMVTILMVRVFPFLPRGSLIAAAAALLAGLFFYFRGAVDVEAFTDDTLFPATKIQAIINATSATQSPWMPSYWASQGLLLASWGRYARSAFYFLLLASNALMLTFLAATLADRFFYRGWSNVFGRERSRQLPGDRGLLNWIERALRWIPRPFHPLVVKDLKLFWRDPTQWTQFMVFFGIMAVYIATLRPQNEPGFEHYRSWIAAMNIGASTLILATLTSRFIYPMISLEGRRFWILGLAPITFRQIVMQKFWLSVVVCSFFTVSLVVLSCVRLQVALIPFLLALYSIVVTNFGLSGLAVGLGSLYPNFNEDNPARIVSGMGGTLNFLLSMGYIALVVAAQTVVLQWQAFEPGRLDSLFWWALGGVLVGITLLSAACTIVPLRLGLRNLSDIEI